MEAIRLQAANRCCAHSTASCDIGSVSPAVRLARPMAVSVGWARRNTSGRVQNGNFNGASGLARKKPTACPFCTRRTLAKQLVTGFKPILAGLVITVLGGASAPAQTSIDIARITCAQFILQQVTDPRNVTIWPSGYHAKRGDTVIQLQQFEENAKKVTMPTGPISRAR